VQVFINNVKPKVCVCVCVCVSVLCISCFYWRVRGRVHERLTSHQEEKQNRMCSTNLGKKNHSVPCVVTDQFTLSCRQIYMEHKNEENICWFLNGMLFQNYVSITININDKTPEEMEYKG